jgi:hypothetical protein
LELHLDGLIDEKVVEINVLLGGKKRRNEMAQRLKE